MSHIRLAAPSQLQESPIVFLHNFRCGGNVFNNMFLQSFDDSTFKYGTWGAKHYDFKAFLESARNPEIAFYLGHLCYGVHRHVDRPVQYVTNVRSSVARLASGYIWGLNEGMAIRDWLSRNPESDNGITRRLAGIGKSPDGTDRLYDYSVDDEIDDRICVDEAIYLKARNTLEHECRHIFVQERFAESLVLFEHKFNLPPLVSLFQAHYNRSPVSTYVNGETLPADLVAWIEEANSFDAKLLDIANRRLTEETSKMGEDFWEEVRITKLFNRIFGDSKSGGLSNEGAIKRLESCLQIYAQSGLLENLAGIIRLIVLSPLSPTELCTQLKQYAKETLPLEMSTTIDEAFETRNGYV